MTVKHVPAEESLKKGARYLSESDAYQGYDRYLMTIRYKGKGAYRFEEGTNNSIFGIRTASLEKMVKEVVQIMIRRTNFFSIA